MDTPPKNKLVLLHKLLHFTVYSLSYFRVILNFFKEFHVRLIFQKKERGQKITWIQVL